MSKLLDRFRYFKTKGDSFANGHGQVYNTNRDWEDGYRQRWQFDKIVRSTHGVNCTGSCSWKIYVKNGLVTWETQQTDYPRTRPDLPNHEPRGCPRGASYSWYLYSANRLKYPLVRRRLIELWREALAQHTDPVLAWDAIQSDPQKAQSYNSGRPFLHRGALQGHQNRRHHAGLLGSREAERPVAGPQTGHRQRPRHGDGPRDPQRISPR